MAKYIKLDTIKERLEELVAWCQDLRKPGLEQALAMLNEEPVADVALVVHGRWIERQTPHAMGGVSGKCSVCAKSVQYLGNSLNYCPNCGAKMDGGVDDACL